MYAQTGWVFCAASPAQSYLGGISVIGDSATVKS
jgi:hypothetical protein